jgi:hypothetical protein
MIRFVLLLVLVGVVGVPRLPDAPAGDPKKADAVLVIGRGGGFVDPNQNPFAHYAFTLAGDGAWEFKPLKGPAKKGKLGDGEVGKWLKAIDDGGFAKLKSNPALGAADESYMDIAVRPADKKDRKRIRLEAPLAQALDRKILELARPGQ